MKKLALALAAFTMIAAPTVAEARDNHGHHHHKRGNSTGKVVLGILGGMIIGGAIAESARRDRYRDEYRDHRYNRGMPDYNGPYRPNVYPYNQYYCVTEQQVDYYGNVYYTRRCNY